MVLAVDRTAQVVTVMVAGRRTPLALSQRQVDRLVDGSSSPWVLQRRRVDQHAAAQFTHVIRRQPTALRLRAADGRAQPVELELTPAVLYSRRSAAVNDAATTGDSGSVQCPGASTTVAAADGERKPTPGRRRTTTTR